MHLRIIFNVSNIIEMTAFGVIWLQLIGTANESVINFPSMQNRFDWSESISGEKQKTKRRTNQ